MNTSRKRGPLAALSAFAAAALLVVAGGAAAQAAPTIPDAPAPDERGTLNIHKFEQPDALGSPADGMEQDTTGLTAMAGVEFTIKQVTSIDLSTNAGWIAAGALTLDTAATEVSGDTGTTVATNADGLAQFPKLPIGLYYVEETKWPSGATPAKPFLVTVPITNERAIIGNGTASAPEFPARSTWVYDVHVYPKNAVTSGTKSVEDSTTNQLGQTVKWTISADIPKAEVISAYRIVDELDSRLELVETGAKAPTLELTGNSNVTLIAGTDYVWSNTSGKLQVDFTPTGLAKLVTAWKADASAQIRVVLNTTVVAVGDGEILNQATIYPNQEAIDWTPGDDTPPPPTTTEPKTKWGHIVLEKVAQGSKDPLQGAEFQVYLNEADAKNGANPITVTIDEAGNEIVGGKHTFVSGSDGRVIIPGLRDSRWANNTAVAPGETGYQSYWIVETKSPVGADGTKYELLAEPIEVEVSSSDITVVTREIVNVPKNGGFELPLTGGGGTWALTAGGVLLIGGGLLLTMRRKRA